MAGLSLQIYKVLRENLDQQRTGQAFKVWNAVQKREVTVDLADYMKELLATVKLNRDEIQTLRQAVEDTLSMHQALDPSLVPRQETSQSRVVNTATPHPRTRRTTPAVVVFSSIVDSMVRIARSEETQFGSLVRDYLRVSNANRESQNAFLSYLAGNIAPEDFNLSENELIKLVHTLYVVVCDAVGPVQADRIVGDSIRVAQGLPEAKLFDPSRFF